MKSRKRATPMKLLKIKDNSRNKKSEFDIVKNTVGKIADKTLGQLQKEGVLVFPPTIMETEDLDEDQFILQSVNDTYKSGNIMGFMGYGDERLIIESRFSGNKDYFFQYVLEKVLDVPNVIDLETEANHNNRFFNLLIFLFPYYLKNAMRKGIFKTYTRNRYNDSNVRGTIDVARHIAKNIPFVGNIAYTQREHSYDNALMELIRHTIEFIKKKPYGNHLLLNVNDEVKAVIEVTLNYEVYDKQRVISENKKNTVRHAYFQEYRSLQNLCILILQHQREQIGTGDRQVYGVLFDGAWLWEEYVNSLIADLFYHPQNKKEKGKQHLFSGSIGRIYPDFISKNTEERIIADAKYKPLENIRRDDYQQVLAYMFRFDANKGYYLYPEKGDTEAVVLKMNSGSTYENNVKERGNIYVTKHGLTIPNDAENYSQFTERMKVSEQKFKKTLSVL